MQIKNDLDEIIAHPDADNGKELADLEKHVSDFIRASNGVIVRKQDANQAIANCEPDTYSESTNGGSDSDDQDDSLDSDDQDGGSDPQGENDSSIRDAEEPPSDNEVSDT